MAGSLIKINEATASDDATLSCTGMTPTYDVYIADIYNVRPASDNTNLYLRFTEGGSANSTANYDFAYRVARSDTVWNINGDARNLNQVYIDTQLADEYTSSAGRIYIFNSQNSGEYTHFTWSNSKVRAGVNTLRGKMGGGGFTVTSVVDGIEIFMSSGNLTTAQIVLYGVSK